ncbi:hypothetical protein HYU09_00960 [Candidatus Woesearchaeota archaeon]|nr:hypothetical protein [Candidatus Woesearchaeota archaeon]
MKSKGTLIQFIALLLLEIIILYPVSFVHALDISNVQITDVSSSSARIKWFTDEVADGKVKYGPTKDLGFTSRHSTFIFEHSQLLQGLDSEKTYFLEIESSNVNGDIKADNNNGQMYSFTTKDITPPAKVEGLAVTGKTKSSITMAWQASGAQDLSRYNIFRNSIRIANSTGTTFTDTGLNPGSSFSYKVSAVDAAGNEGAQSDTVIVSTEASGLSSPVISDVDIAEITDTSATITWLTSKNSTSIVFFGADQALDRVEEIKQPARNHSVTLEDLEKGASYSFIAGSCDNDNNCANSSLSTFKAGLGAIAPSINATIPMFVNKKEIGIAGSIEPFSSVKLFVNDLNFPARALDSKETSKGTFEFQDVQLQKENVIKLLATDKAGNKNEAIFRVSVDTENPVVIIDQVPGMTSKKNLTIIGTVDEPVFINFFLRFGSKEKPEKITGLKGAAKNNSVTLEWNETKDRDFSHYVVYRKDVGPIAVAKPASYDTYTDLLVNKGQEYSYWITAIDKFGKESDKSDAVAVKVTEGRQDIPKPQPIDSLIIEKPELNISVNNSFSGSLKLEKDGDYTLLMEVIDRANNRVTVQRTLTLDTKKPDIKITNPPSGTMIFENYANEIDIKGITEPNAKVHLYIERTPLGPLNRSADIAGLPDDIFNIDDSKLDADCALKIGGKNFCPESADFSTTADSAGNFEFDNVDITSIAAAGLSIEQVPGTRLMEEIRPETTKTSRLIFIATDPVGLRNAKEHTVRVGTCWSGNQSWDLIPLSEFQSPTFLSPQRLAENKESIYFFFNYSYIGRGKDGKIDSVSLQKACSGTEVLGDKRFNTSCKILPSGGFSTAVNPEGTVTYTQIKLNRVENMDKFLQNDWNDFFNSLSNELAFPLKFTIRYRHTVDGKEIVETQTTCQEVSYVMDNSIIDPREILPDWLLYDFVDFLQNSIKAVNDINEQLSKVVDFVTVGCVSSFVLRIPVQFYRRLITFSEEKIFQLKDISKSIIPGSNNLIKFNVKTEQDQEYCNAVANSVKTQYKLGAEKNALFGLKLKYFSDNDLKRCFPEVAGIWDTEASLYTAYRYTCDRIFGHQTPSAWTENLDDERIYQRILEGSQCPNDQSVYGRPIQAVKCSEAAPQFFARQFFAVQNQDRFGVDDICFVVPISNIGTGQLGSAQRGNQLFQLGKLVEGTQNIYEITGVTQIGYSTEVRYAIKQTEKSFLTNRPETCEQLCTGSAPGLQKDTAIMDGKTYNTYPIKDLKKDPRNPTDPNKKAIPVCETAARCNEWAAQAAQTGQKAEIVLSDNSGKEVVVNIDTAKRQGYTSDCFPPKTEFSDVSDNPQQRYECCCLNTKSQTAPTVYYLYDDFNRYEDDKGAKQSSFQSKSGEGVPAGFNDMQWSYRYWKEGYITLSKQTTQSGRNIQHNQYNPNRYIEGRDYPACFGQNNYLYDGGLLSPGPAEGDVGKLVMIDSRQQFESAFFCANIAGIQNRLVMLNNMQSALASCLIDVRQTGTSDAAACKEFFTRYVCSSVWQAINFAQSLFTDSCSLSPIALDANATEDYAATISDGFKAVTQSITDSQSELAGEYGNAELNNLLGTGTGEIARKVCLAAFGYDWDLSLQNIVDAAYSQSFETLVQKTTGTREYLTIDPTSGQARYDYRSSWIINPGCEIESYRVELACVSRNELNREGAFVDPLSSIGVASRGIRCDAVGSPDGNNCDCLNLDKEQTRTFFTSKGKLLQNKFVQQAQDEIVSSLYRYDHLKFTLRPSPKLKGNLRSTCFPPGHEDGVFYFPLSDKTARDIAACKLEPISGVFQCTGALDFWSKKGLANIVDVTINGEKPKDNSFTVFRGDPLILTPTIFKTPGSPSKCLVMQLEKQGVGINYPKVETINVDGTYQYSPITLDENVQPVQNLGILPSARFDGCESVDKASRLCQDIMSRQRPTIGVLQRGNIQDIDLAVTFIDEKPEDGRIDTSESSQDIMQVSILGSAVDSKVLGKGGWYDESRKKPVIDKPEYNIKLQINSVPPFTSEVKSATYTQLIPSITGSQTGISSTGINTFTNLNTLSDNIWRLRLSLFEADENTFLCQRYNAGELVQYQGTKQEKTYTIRVAGQSLDADAPRVTVNVFPAEIKQTGETARLTVEATDETKLGKINFELTKPGAFRSNWNNVNSQLESLCRSDALQGSGDSKVCLIDVDGSKLDADIPGTYRVTVTVPDEDKISHLTTREATIEVLCGPSSDNSYGVCMQGGRCSNVLKDVGNCQTGFECCRRFQG